MTHSTHYRLHLCLLLIMIQTNHCHRVANIKTKRDRRGRDRMVVGLTTTYVISV